MRNSLSDTGEFCLRYRVLLLYATQEEPTPEPIVVEEPTIEEAETTDAEETILSVEETEEETEAETEEVTEEETEPETDEDDLLSNNPVIFGLRSANGLMLTAGGAIP